MKNIYLLILGILLLAAPMISDAKTLEELLVEKGVISKTEGASTAKSAPARIYWKNGTRIDFPDTAFSFGINTFLQTRYTFSDNDAKTNTSSFDINKARIIVKGTALYEEFEYLMNVDFVGHKSEDGTKSPALLDAYLKWNVCDAASFKMGQFKTGVSRQFNASDQALQFADRSNVSNYFDLGRQGGLQAVSELGDSVTMGAGIFNGKSEGEDMNVPGKDTKHTGVLNLRANVLGKMDPFIEGDVDTTKDLAFNAGLAYAYSDLESANEAIHQDDVSVDANLKYLGTSVNGEFFYRNYDPAGGASVQPFGGYVQAGYFVEPEKFEIAARYGITDCDDGAAKGVCSGFDQINEATIGLNYYWWKHNLKAQLNYSLINSDPVGANTSDVTDNRWLFQLSSFF